jgi:hypothetical protein
VPTAIIPGSGDIHPTHVGENLHRIMATSKLYDPMWTPEEREELRLKDPVGLATRTEEKAAAVFLPFLEELERSKVSTG